jgi:ATP-dependent Lhr-like helicase
MLLDRYGIAAREVVLAEGLAGGFASIAPLLRALEDAGKVRRGYFVEGLGGAQYAHLAAVDRLRAERSPESEQEVVVLSAIDPANPYGALLPWPGDGDARPRRVAGARVVLVGGAPVFFVEPGGKRLRLLAAEPSVIELALGGLRTLAGRRRHRQLRIEQVNGVPALRSEHVRLFERGGFHVEPSGLVLSV